MRAGETDKAMTILDMDVMQRANGDYRVLELPPVLEVLFHSVTRQG